jgi:hypothetical protein
VDAFHDPDSGLVLTSATVPDGTLVELHIAVLRRINGRFEPPIAGIDQANVIATLRSIRSSAPKNSTTTPSWTKSPTHSAEEALANL